MIDVAKSGSRGSDTAEGVVDFFDRAYGRNPSLGEVRDSDLSSLKLPAREDLGMLFWRIKDATVHPLVQGASFQNLVEGAIQDGLERVKVVLSREEWDRIVIDMREQCDRDGRVTQVPPSLREKYRS